jgi:hypothetical protein
MRAESKDRRRLLAAGATGLAAGVAMVWSGSSRAQTNPQIRQALKYQDGPKGDQQCNTCLHWVPGKTAKDRGGCKIIPGDTQISPTGWCTAWAKAK